MKKNQIIGSAVVLLLIIAAVSNPDSATHKEKVRTELKKYLDESMAEKSEGEENFASGFASLIGNTMVNSIVDNTVTADNYLLFSLTKISHEGNAKRIGFGAFGNVWLSKEVQKELDQK